MKLLFFSSILFVIGAVLTFYWVTSSREDIGVQQSVVFAPSEGVPTPRPTPTVVVPVPPVAKTLTGGTQVFQTFNNCGPASLSMALSYFGYSVTQQTLGQELRPFQHPTGDNDDKSVTLVELAKKAEEYNLIAYYRPGGDIPLLHQFIAQDIPVITRTWLKSNDYIGHFRVVKGYDQNTGTLIQDDSLQGKDLSYPNESFLELWKAFNYEFLVLVPKEKQAIAEAILGERLDPQTAWENALFMAEQDKVAAPTNHFAEFNASVALYYLGRYQESIEAFERAEPHLPFRMLWYQVEPLIAYYHAGDLETVLEKSNAILANQNRAYSELYYLQGLVYQKQAAQGLVNESLATEAFAKAERYNTAHYWRYNVELNNE